MGVCVEYLFGILICLASVAVLLWIFERVEDRVTAQRRARK